jgi:hypothetical protein
MWSLTRLPYVPSIRHVAPVAVGVEKVIEPLNLLGPVAVKVAFMPRGSI